MTLSRVSTNEILDHLELAVLPVEWGWGEGHEWHRSSKMEKAARALAATPGVAFTAWSRKRVCTIHLISPIVTLTAPYMAAINGPTVQECIRETAQAAATMRVGGGPVWLRSYVDSTTWDFLIPEAELKAREFLAPLKTHQCGTHSFCYCRATGLEHGRNAGQEDALGVFP